MKINFKKKEIARFFKPDSMEVVSSLYLKPFLCKLGLKCDFQNLNISPNVKLFIMEKKTRQIYSFPVLKVLEAPYSTSSIYSLFLCLSNLSNVFLF